MSFLYCLGLNHASLQQEMLQSEERNVQQLHIRNNSKQFHVPESGVGIQAVQPQVRVPAPGYHPPEPSGTRPGGWRESYWHRLGVNPHSNESQNLLENLASACHQRAEERGGWLLSAQPCFQGKKGLWRVGGTRCHGEGMSISI